MSFRQVTHDDLGCATSSVTRVRASPPSWIRARHRRVPAPRALPRGADRARRGDAQPRRPRLRLRASVRRDWRDDPRPAGRRGSVRPRALRRRLGAAPRRPDRAREPHAGHRPEHRRSRSSTGARRYAVGGPEQRLAVRGRHRASRPRDREGRGRGRHLPLAPPAAADAAGNVRGVAGPSRRVAVRRPRDGPLVNDRLRAGGRRAHRAGERRRSCRSTAWGEVATAAIALVARPAAALGRSPVGALTSRSAAGAFARGGIVPPRFGADCGGPGTSVSGAQSDVACSAGTTRTGTGLL
jgi:hypothetical protein